MTVQVVVADDNAEFLAAVHDVLSAAPGIEVVAAVTTGAAAVAATAEHRPDVVVLDVEMPGGGAALVADLSRRTPSVRLMCLSARDDPDTVVAMLVAGAIGYVAKGGLDDDLATWVRRRADGTPFVIADCAPAVSRHLAERFRSSYPG